MAAGPNRLIFSGFFATPRIASFLQGIMPPQSLLPSKNAGNLAVARDPEKMQGFWPAAILGPPSAYVESENSFFKKASQLRSFFGGAFWLPSRWSRDTVAMQGIELATIFGAVSTRARALSVTIEQHWLRISTQNERRP